ncbi:MAG: hypothetical protein ISS92_05820 [Candidatus Omnitrophica bacterium]|nr:hypothetical protein [Candidatus Omnitrophota bacterium]
MYWTKRKFLSKLFNAGIILLYLCNIVAVDCSHASGTPETKLPVDAHSIKTIHAKYNPDDLIQRESSNKEIVEQKNNIIECQYLGDKQKLNQDTLNLTDIAKNKKDYSILFAELNLSLDDVEYLPEDILSFYRENGEKETLEYIEYVKNTYKKTEEKANKNDDKNSDEYDLNIVLDPGEQEPHEATDDIDIEELIKSLFLTPFDINGDGIIDREDIDLIWHALGEADIYFESPGLKYFIIDQNGDGEINEEDYLIAFGQIDLSASDTDSLEYFIYSLLVELFDANGNERIDAEDDNTLEYWRIFDRNRYRLQFGSSLPDREMQELLGCIFVWIARNGWNKDMPLDLGNGIEANFSEAADGESYTVTLSNDDWTITMTYTRPPGVDTTTIDVIGKAFGDLENAKDDLYNEMTPVGKGPRLDVKSLGGEGENADKTETKNTDKKYIKFNPQEDNAAPEEAPSNSKSVNNRNYTEQKEAEPKTDAYSPLNHASPEEGDHAIHAGTRYNKDISQNQPVTGNSDKTHDLLKNEWHEAKGALYKMFKHILTEEAGAVYSTGDGAVILLESFKTSDDSDEEEDEDESSNA